MTEIQAIIQIINPTTGEHRVLAADLTWSQARSFVCDLRDRTANLDGVVVRRPGRRDIPAVRWLRYR